MKWAIDHSWILGACIATTMVWSCGKGKGKPAAPVITAPSAMTTATRASASVAAQSGFTYRWAVSGATITGDGGSAGVVTGRVESIAFIAGPVGAISLTCIAVDADGMTSDPGSTTIV